ncbi:hypothetical protein, partial [Serratia marcescens]|uniref:hypothetical protein n=1 Tax=Serratia marcescens TaxID=615 RepID=UPI001CA3018A
KLDYINCKICNGVIHQHDARCRWCGSKKISRAIAVNAYRLCVVLSALTFFFILGFLNVNPFLAALPGIVISFFLSKKYESRWLTKYWY